MRYAAHVDRKFFNLGVPHNAKHETVMCNYMKTTTIILLTLLTIACTDKSTVEKKTELELYYLPCWQQHRSPDTISYKENSFIDPKDTLLAREVFQYKEQYHEIKMYTSDYHANIDGGGLFYTLDSLGVIYMRATSWPSFTRLSSNNDSINDLVSTALGFIASKSSLRCYHCDDRFTHIRKTTEIK